MVQDITVDAHVEHELGHVGTLPGERHFRESVIDANDRGAHFVTGSHRFSKQLMCSREPTADTNAVVLQSGLKTVTASWTYDVSHPTNSDMRSG